MSNPDQISADKLADLWMHQSTLSWSRIRTAFAFQIVVIAGWYYSMTDDLPEVSLPLATFGVVLAFTFTILARSDLRVRKAVRDGLATKDSSLPFPAARGTIGIGLIFLFLLACNGAMAWTSWKHPDCMAAPTDDNGQSVSHTVSVWGEPIVERI
ncbi:MAG TPA: hypothetical protein VNB29_10135 [Chthoniobacterales bacterium]|nr:hypothetical protein [Chthoniobacterales bacterium]